VANFPALNIYDARYLYFIGNIRVAAGGGDVLHFEQCYGVLLRGITVRGTGGPAINGQQPNYSVQVRSGLE
jgi:hypothetical protein